MSRLIHARISAEVLALIIGFAAHAVVLFVVLPALSPSVGTSYGIGFADNYDNLALNLLNGNGFRFTPETADTLMREPGYPVLLATAFSIFGYSLSTARALNLLLTAGTAWLLIGMVRSFTTDRRVGVAAMVLLLAHPGVVIAEARGGFETLYAFCLLLFAWRFMKALNTEQRRDYFWAGVALGLAALVRSSLIALPIIALICLLLRPGRRAPYRTIIGMATLSLSMCLTLLPWAARNYSVVHTVVPTATISGIAFHVGEYVCRNRNSGRTLQELDTGARDERTEIARAAGYQFEDNFFPFFFSAKDELDFSSQLTRKVMDYYKTNPGVFLGCAGSNLINFWIAGKNPRASVLNGLVQIPYLLLAAVGAIWLRGRAGGSACVASVLLIVAYTMALHSVSFAQARYSIPLVPLLAMLGSEPLAELWNWVSNRHRNAQGQSVVREGR